MSGSQCGVKVEVVCDCDVSRIGKEDREMIGKNRLCSVKDLEQDTEHAVCVRCCVGEWTMWRWML